MKLTDAEKLSLYELTISTGRPDSETPRLAKLGLVEQGSGRFGGYVRITAKGKALALSWPKDEQVRLLTGSGQESGRGRRAASGVLAAVKGERSLSTSAAHPSTANPLPRTEDEAPPAPIGPASDARAPGTSQPGGVSSRGAAPRVRRAAAKQADAGASAFVTATLPPAVPLQAGASSKSKPSLLRQQRIPTAANSPAGSAAGCRETPKAASDPAPSTSSTPPRPASLQRAFTRARAVTPPAEEAPNALRHTLGAVCVYYPINTNEAGFLNGTLERVFTRNKLYRSYAVGASATDDRVFP